MLLAPDDHGVFGGGPYNDDELDDEFYWAAVEMFLATDEQPFLDDLERSPCHHADVFEPDGFDWDRVAVPARLDLATIDSRLTDRTRVQQSVISGADRIIEIQRTQPWAQPYAPADGWDWGSNGRILNNLVVLATAYDLTARRDYLDATLTGIDFLLGLNALGQSYVTGYGTDHTCHQRTRHFAHDLDPAFPPPPPGAIAGGPNSKTYPGFPSDDRLRGLPPQLCYLDEPTSETTNDVCIRWNAPLVWIAMFLDEHQGGPESTPITADLPDQGGLANRSSRRGSCRASSDGRHRVRRRRRGRARHRARSRWSCHAMSGGPLMSSRPWMRHRRDPRRADARPGAADHPRGSRRGSSSASRSGRSTGGTGDRRKRGSGSCPAYVATCVSSHVHHACAACSRTCGSSSCSSRL